MARDTTGETPWRIGDIVKVREWCNPEAWEESLLVVVQVGTDNQCILQRIGDKHGFTAWHGHYDMEKVDNFIEMLERSHR